MRARLSGLFPLATSLALACGGKDTTGPQATGVAFATLSAGDAHTCGLTAAGTVYCWGLNGTGQLGTDTAAFSTSPVAVSGGLTFAAVSTSNHHTCALTAAGTAYCWGYNFYGQLGNGTTVSSFTPVAVSGGLTFAAVSAGGDHTCAVTTAGALYCWGYNHYGQLGTGTATGPQTCFGFSCSTAPVAVSGGLTFAAVSAGSLHTCAVTTAGAAYCWGSDLRGQLGNGSTVDSNMPVAVSGGLTFAAVSAGRSLSCAVTTAGAAYCWGLNTDGQLGTGTVSGPQLCSSYSCSTAPVAASGGLTFAAVSARGDYTCAVTTSGAAYCWGHNLYGRFGNGTGNTTNSTPVAVSGGLTFTAVSAGTNHTCAVTTAGAAYCWGLNTEGQLGNGSTTQSLTPVRVSNP